jgi:glutathione peroxidase
VLKLKHCDDDTDTESQGDKDMKVHDFTVMDSRGNEKSLGDYQGKALLIVNTASACGHTPQYADLQQVYGEWAGRGLEILGFPCNQFGAQEPGTDEEIQQFCQLNYGVSFPVFAKIEVNGEGAHPLYQYLTAQKEGPKGKDIEWNFTKFLVDPQGNVVGRYPPNVKPQEILGEVERLLVTE